MDERAGLNFGGEVFRNLRLFQGVSPDGIEHLLQDCPWRGLAEEEVLLAPGQTNQNVFVLLDGALRIHLDSRDSPPLTRIQPGECVGEMSIIDNEIASAYVIADQPSRLMVISQEILWQMINVSHQVARNLLHILSRRMRFNNDVIVESCKRQGILEHYARVDPLTGLYNRRWLDESLPRQIQRCRHNGQPLTLIFIDADHFKIFNDRHGHLAGDFALITLAQTLTETLRPGDFAARFGGEEFCVVLPDTTLDEGRAIAERVRQVIAATDILTGEGQFLPPLTISAGLAETRGEGTATTLIAVADAALFQAKDQGRNCVRAELP
ncbi:MAG: GGDEF domain-containing protein [Magnetococcales bacterium]|nr:GGDEF domain-containing protein [Magnetococcales bacterium]